MLKIVDEHLRRTCIPSSPEERDKETRRHVIFLVFEYARAHTSARVANVRTEE